MGHSPAVAGLVISAQSVSWMFAAFAAGRLMIRTSYRLTAAIGGVALVAGAAMLVMLGPETDPFWAAAAGFVMGIGMGFCNTTFIVAIQTSVGWHERGIGTGSQMFMRMLGMAVGAAIFGAIINYGSTGSCPAPAAWSTGCSTRRRAAASTPICCPARRRGRARRAWGLYRRAGNRRADPDGNLVAAGAAQPDANAGMTRRGLMPRAPGWPESASPQSRCR